MIHLLKKGALLATVFMFGFILGIVYINHAANAGQEKLGFVLHSPLENKKENEDNPSTAYVGFKWKDSYEMKIDMETEEGIVVYDEEEMSRHDFIQQPDLHRDLLDKQNYVVDTKNNLFSEMGLKTADAFQGVFRKIFAVLE